MLGVGCFCCCLVFIVSVSPVLARPGRVEIECQGSEYGLTQTQTSDPWSRYQGYVQNYRNCTVVLNNLEIVGLRMSDGQNESYDMSFLERIEEVHGYVLIANNHVDLIPLTSLRVIHGRKLYETSRRDSSRNYSLALYVMSNVKHQSEEVGLKEIHLNSLHEIVDGNVMFYGNDLLRFHDTIEWKDILANPAASSYIETEPNAYLRTNNDTCDKACLYNETGKRHCWGIGPQNCQKINRLNCSPFCFGRCYGPDPSQCCDYECVGGCLSSYQKCWSCRGLEDNGNCVSSCPPPTIYNTNKFQSEPNPKVKYSLGRKCVDKCPDNMNVDHGACLKDCERTKEPDANRTCQTCVGPCPKKCNGGEINGTSYVNFIGCTVIQGHLRILSHAFLNLTIGEQNIPALTVEHLNVLESVKEIHDYLLVQMVPANIKSLSCLRNLQHIRGRTQYSQGKLSLALAVTHNNMTSLGLTSLKSVQGGAVCISGNTNLEELGLVSFNSASHGVVIVQNPALCYVDSITDRKAFTSASFVVKTNRPADQCISENRTCSELCNGGCWGAGDGQCVTCKGVRYGHTCLTSCSAMPGLYDDHTDNDVKLCKQCDRECDSNCTGEGPSKCLNCRKKKKVPTATLR